MNHRRICWALVALLGACREPPAKDSDRVDPPPAPGEKDDAIEFRRKAHGKALAQALPLAHAALKASDPLAAYRAGQGPAAITPLSIGERAKLADRVEEAQVALAEIDESYLNPPSVVILRAVRFAITRLNDELERRPSLRQDPVAAVREVAIVLDELVYRLVQDDCDPRCEAMASELAITLPTTRSQLAAASPAATRRAEVLARALAGRSRELAARPALQRYARLQTGLTQLGTALDEHASWLVEVGEALPNAKNTHVWTADPAPIRPGGVAAIERLPDVVGARTLSRRIAVEERIVLDAEDDIARVANHVRRWQALGRELVPDSVPEESPEPLDVERCEAALARIRSGLAGVEGVDAPQLRCDRYVEVIGDRRLRESELILELLDYGVIEPQRRVVRRRELPELAMISGQWSPTVHTHLRRIMLLARLDEPAARELAITQGTRALCLAEAALWVHTELALPSAAGDAVGSKCAVLDEGEPLLDLILGDPRGALAGFGLSLIGDEPARMVGFDRFYWAPLGLMQTLATPIGMHPDQFVLPSETQGAQKPSEVDVKIEELSP